MKAVEHSPGQGRYSPLTAIAEDHFHDRKSRRVTSAKLTKAMSAFANADGGELLVSIENDGGWDGFGKIEDCNGHLQAMEMLFPYGSEFNYEFLRHPADGTVVLQVTIQKSRGVKAATDGKVYVRRGAQSLPVDALG